MAQNMDIDYLLRMIRDKTGDQEYDPLVELKKIAMDPETPVAQKIKANSQISSYIYAQKKSVEVNANIQGDMELRSKTIESMESILGSLTGAMPKSNG